MKFLVSLVSSLLLVSSVAVALELDPVLEAKRLEEGMARLCGVWDWTVHSHTMSHREAKAQIVLPSPEAVGLEGPSPNEIRVYGDAVYFRWISQGVVQEDSLLLTDNKRLEGTFRTSTGSVGAVNGKRLSTCSEKKPDLPRKSEPMNQEPKTP